MATKGEQPYTEVALLANGKTVHDVRCDCGEPLVLDYAVGAGTAEVLLTCEHCHVCYVITVRCD